MTRDILDRIYAVEETATFKVFVTRIWLHNYDEYLKLFGDNPFKRKITTDWCLETYPHLLLKLQQQWKHQRY